MSPLSKLFDVSVEEMLAKGGGSAQHIPSGTALNLMRESIQNTVMNHVKNRSDGSDRVLRELQKMRSQRTARDREREREKAADKEAEERKHKLKKVSKKREPDEERPLAVGAHGVARQDGVGLHKGEWSIYCSHSTCCPKYYYPLSSRPSYNARNERSAP
jgi:transcriptional adapter 3